MGVMIGDAMGMPVEMMAPAAILEKTDGRGISGFSHPIQRKVKDTINLVPGSTTDDWQLTESILKSLIRRKCFDISDIALSQVESYETSTFGWGGTTRAGLAELKEYFDSRGKSGRSPFDNPGHGVGGSSRGCGNGIAMKIAPVGLFAALTYTEGEYVKFPDESIAFEFFNLAERVAGVGRLTHFDVRSWAAAFAVAEVIAESLVFDYFNFSCTDEDLRSVQYVLERVIKKVQRFESMYASGDPDVFSKRIEKLTDPSLLLGPVEDLRKELGTGCIAIESVAFALAVFLRHPRDFRTGLLEAVNSGGDADTIASMVGAMIGTVVGVEEIPSEWRKFHPDFTKAKIMGEEFFKVFRNGS